MFFLLPYGKSAIDKIKVTDDKHTPNRIVSRHTGKATGSFDASLVAFGVTMISVHAKQLQKILDGACLQELERLFESGKPGGL